jgi:hypothetical protein
MRKSVVGTVTVAAMLAVGAIGVSMAGADTSQSFRTITYGTTPPGHRLVVATAGPIVGSGTETLLNPAPEGAAFLKWSFPAGDVFVTLTSTQNFPEAPPVPPTCKVTATISGTYQITGGTGAYAGVTGSGTVTGTGTVFALDRTTGQCSMNAATLFLNTKTYTGTVNLP